MSLSSQFGCAECQTPLTEAEIANGEPDETPICYRCRWGVSRMLELQRHPDTWTSKPAKAIRRLGRIHFGQAFLDNPFRVIIAWLGDSRGMTERECHGLKLDRVAEWLRSDSKPAPTEQGEGVSRSGVPLSAEERKRILNRLEPAERKAYWSYEYAESKKGKKLEDWEAYQLLRDEGISGDAPAGELTDYQLPSEETWKRQLRNARASLGEQKYEKRRGRSHGKSIVKGNEIERQLDKG